MNTSIIDVEIEPSRSALSHLGASEADFTAALRAALNLLAKKSRTDLPRPGEIPILLGGQSRRLGDVAAIRVRIA